MGQDAQGLVVAAFPQPADMRRQGLALRLVVVQDPHLAPDELGHPDGAGVGLGPRSANVPERPIGHQRVRRHMADPALGAGLRQAPGVIGALGDGGVVAFPDVGVLVRRVDEVELPLGLQFRREPVVVAPVGLNHHGVGWKVRAPEKLVDRVGLQLRVPREPQLGAGLADRRAKQPERGRRQAAGLLDPRHVVALQRLDAFRRVVLHPDEVDLAAAGRPDHLVEDLEARDVELPDLVLDQALGAVPQRLLDLTDAQDAERRNLDAPSNSHRGEEVRLARPPTAPGALVASGLEQGQEDPPGRYPKRRHGARGPR